MWSGSIPQTTAQFSLYVIKLHWNWNENSNQDSVLARKCGSVINYELQKSIVYTSVYEMVTEMIVHSHRTSSPYLLQTNGHINRKSLLIIQSVTWKMSQTIAYLHSHHKTGIYTNVIPIYRTKSICQSLSSWACFVSIYLAGHFLSLSNVCPDLWFTIEDKFRDPVFCNTLPLFN